jgi:hypothetical protein
MRRAGGAAPPDEHGSSQRDDHDQVDAEYRQERN